MLNLGQNAKGCSSLWQQQFTNHRRSTMAASHSGQCRLARNLRPAGGSLRAVDDSSPASRTGIWVGLAAITMTFAAFTSAMVVRQGSSWTGSTLLCRPVLYLNTAVLLASSVTWSLRANEFASFMRGSQVTSPDCAALAVRHPGTGFAVCRWTVCSLAAAEGARALSGDESQQLVLLSVYRDPRPACARADSRDWSW